MISTNSYTVIKVCLDTNILISAFLFSGKPAQIFDLAVDGEITLVASPAIVAEFGRVLRHKFKRDDRYIRKQLKIITDVAEVVTPKQRISKLKYDPDNRVLEAALTGNVDYIVTGDKKHLLPLKNFKGISIITASQFLKSWQS